ncbi:ABC transporter permease [Spiractinospora alimapuensis]|uniref:FtsX-like permease family protein n=1 Tax=Spiractinospora alimapuensis TaxID=2820884 RepID=UPI001F259B37|nr:ABC transporter permease [Spiractinospora alimapuensis]QVQ54497.1 ABC transporter permease [Spiractinospora alimapuensis]
MNTISSILHRWRSTLGGFVALALGVALLAASIIVMASSTPTVPRHYAGADVLAVPERTGLTYDGEFSRAVWRMDEADALAEEVGRADGVARAVAERRFEVRVMDGDQVLGDAVPGDPNGAGMSSLPLGDVELRDGEPPSGETGVVLPESYGRSPGDTVTVLTADAEERMTVAATTDGQDVLLPDAFADSVATSVSLIGVVAVDDASPDEVGEHVRQVLGPTAEVFTDIDSGAARSEFDNSNNWLGMQLLIMIVLVALFSSVVIVGATFSFQVAVRRRELGLLRAVGATPRQVRSMLMREAAVVGVAASLVGAALGVGGASVLSEWLVRNDLLAPTWEMRAVALPVGAAVAVGITTALMGVWAASVRGAAVAPLEALRPEEVRADATMPRWRWWGAGLSVLLAAGAAAGAVLTEKDDIIGYALGTTMFLVLAATASAPAYLPRLVRVLPIGGSALGELLHAEARAGARRLASTMMPVLLVAAFAVTMLGMTSTINGAIAEHSVGDLPGDTMVTGPDGDVGVTETALRRVEENSDGAVTSVLATGVYVDGRWVDAAGLHQDAPEAGTIRASPEIATELGWADGDTVELTWRDGTTGRIPVTVGPHPFYTELWADLAMPHDLAREHDPAAFVSNVYPPPESDVDALSAAVADQGSEAHVGATLIDAGVAQETGLIEMFTGVILVLAVGYASISMSNTLSLATSARRRDLALLRVTGAQSRQVGGLVVAESGLVVTIGLLVGGLISAPALLALATGMRDDFRPGEVADVSVHLPWPTLGVVFVACLALGLLAAVIPASRALRQPPAALVAARE